MKDKYNDIRGLEQQIYEMKKRLNTALNDVSNVRNEEVIQLSQELDLLIAEHMKKQIGKLT